MRRGAWAFFGRDEVPERWRRRAVEVMLVPLLPDDLEESAHIDLSNESSSDMEMLHLIAEGSTRQEIARELNMPLRSVDRQIARLCERFRVENSSHLISYLARRGF